MRGCSCIPDHSVTSLTLMRSQSPLPSTLSLYLVWQSDGMWVKCLEIPEVEAPTLPDSCLCHLSSPLILGPFSSPLSISLSPPPFPPTHTPKLPHVMSDLSLPKGHLLSRHLPWWGPSGENPFMIPLVEDGIHRSSLHFSLPSRDHPLLHLNDLSCSSNPCPCRNLF